MVELTRIIDPKLPSDDARQVYFDNVSGNSSMTWFSKSATPRELVTYVLGLLDIDFWKELNFNEFGSAQTHDTNIFMTALAGPHGCALTVWAFGDVAVSKVNAAIGAEYDRMMDELSRGEYSGNAVDAWRTAIDKGELQSEHYFTANDEVFDFVNGSDVISVFDAVFQPEGETSGGSADS